MKLNSIWWWDSNSGVRGVWNTSVLPLFSGLSLLIFLTFSFSIRGERDTIFTMLTVPTSSFSQLPSWTALAQVQISTHFFFSKSPKFPTHRFQAWRHSHPTHISYLGFLLWHLWLSHPPRASVNTCTKSQKFKALPNRMIRYNQRKMKI